MIKLTINDTNKEKTANFTFEQSNESLDLTIMTSLLSTLQHMVFVNSK